MGLILAGGQRTGTAINIKDIRKVISESIKVNQEKEWCIINTVKNVNSCYTFCSKIYKILTYCLPITLARIINAI
jgi:predicted transcriptional regulator